MQTIPQNTRQNVSRIFSINPFVPLLFCALLLLSGCDKASMPKWSLGEGGGSPLERAEARATAGDFPAAIDLYEKALDGTSKTAEIHFRLALIYHDKVNDPVGSIHHFERYLSHEPSGKLADEARRNITAAELRLATTRSSLGLMSKAEAARLRNENLELRARLAQRVVAARPDLANKVAPALSPKVREEVKKAESSARDQVKRQMRTHTVQSGETLASIARKYFNSTGRWKDIQDANMNQLPDPAKLKVGTVLIIPD